MTARTLQRIISTHQRALKGPRDGTEGQLSARSENEIRTLFSHSHGPLLPIKLEVCSNGETVIVNGRFKNSKTGRGAGEFYRELKVRKGEIFIHHNNFRISPTLRGLGWGHKWFAECERRYREFGIVAISIEAGSDVGGYVWAREGFSLTDQGQKVFWPNVLWRLRCLHEEDVIDERTLRRWERGIASKRISTVQDVMCLGRWRRWVDGEGRWCWPGKLALIEIDWDGFKLVSPPQDSTI